MQKKSISHRASREKEKAYSFSLLALYENYQKKIWLIPVVMILSLNLFSQDSVFVKSIDEMTRRKYDLQNKSYWLLTKEKITHEASGCATEVNISLIDDSLYRIVCMGNNEKGKWAKEYYPINGELAFCYCTNEFSADDSTATNSKNWKGYPTSEFRAFFKSGRLLNEKHDGIKDENHLFKTIQTLPAEYQQILLWVRRKLPGVILK